MAKSLKIKAASLSEMGRKQPPINEDHAAWHLPEESYLCASKGAVLAVADGVSSAGAGKEASNEVVDRFIAEYFQTPDTWSVAHCGEKILSTINLRLYRRSLEYTSHDKGFLTTFSALVLKGQIAHFFHIGDSRIYLWRKDDEGPLATLSCLTQDHSRHISESQSFLTRAMGMDNHLPLDYGKQEIKVGDRLLLTSDGVHDFIDAAKLEQIMAKPLEPELAARELLDLALENDSDDNLSAVVVHITELADASLEDRNTKLKRLPFPPDDLQVGMSLDGYRIEKELFCSSRSQLYLVTDIDSGQSCAMKIPSRNFEGDEQYIDRFVQEEWVGQRVKSPYVVSVIRGKRERTALYYLMEYVEGQSLDKWISQNQPPSPKKAISIIEQVAKGLTAFHENEAIHQDLKPANIMLTEDGRAVIVDFGSVYVAGLAEQRLPSFVEDAMGTASYADPLYLLGENPGIAGDVYSLATIAYEIFTGHLPYGSGVEEFTKAGQYYRLRYISASQHNTVIPLWFDRALEKGVQFDVQQRYTTVDALFQDLRNPNAEFLREDPPTQSSSSGLLFWKLLSGLLLGMFVLLGYLFSQVS